MRPAPSRRLVVRSDGGRSGDTRSAARCCETSAAGVERLLLDPDACADLDIDRTAWTGKVKETAAPVTDEPELAPARG